MAPLGAVGRVVILSPPIPWSDVPAGAQVLLWGEPRTVIMIGPGNHPGGVAMLYFEGILGAMVFTADERTQIVIMDEADAVTNLLAAGFTATPIEES